MRDAIIYTFAVIGGLNTAGMFALVYLVWREQHPKPVKWQMGAWGIGSNEDYRP